MLESNYTSQNPIADPNSIYYIHPNENPTVSLVSEKCNGDNYADWKRAMVLALSMKNKIAFIDGSMIKPEPTDPLFKGWERCNNMIISYLPRSVDNTIAKSVLYFSTAYEIWKDLEDRYSVISGPQLFSLQQNLSKINQDDSPIAVFFTKIKGIWDQISAANPTPICTCNGCSCNFLKKFIKNQQDERLVQFLMKLDNKHNAVRTNILMMNPLPNISVAYNLLIQDERQQEIADVLNKHSTMAFTASDGVRGGINRPTTLKKNNLYCEYCKMTNHTIHKCYKLKGYPKNEKNNKGIKGRRVAAMTCEEESDDEPDPETDLCKQLVNLIKESKKCNDIQAIEKANTAGKSPCSITCLNSKWIIDSGATDHICSNLELFDNYNVFDKSPNKITVADGKKLKIENIGTITFENGIILKNVLHVPKLQFNLISTHKLCKDMDCNIVFTHDKCMIQDHSQRSTLVLGNLESGLYAVKIDDGKTRSSVNIAATEELKLMHLRMGHIPFNRLQLVNDNLANRNGLDCICQICPRAKQTRNSFPKTGSRSKNCFDLLHIDVWGPYKIRTHNDCKYFLTIVDDFSRHTWTFMMKNKNDSVDILDFVITFIHNQFDVVVKAVRSDNAKELCEGKCNTPRF